jgi:hypothetical protein
MSVIGGEKEGEWRGLGGERERVEERVSRE